MFDHIKDLIAQNKELIAAATGIWLGIQTVGKGLQDANKAVPVEVKGWQRFVLVGAKFFAYVTIGKRAE